MKWEPAVLMVILLGLGVWLCKGPWNHDIKPRQGTRVVDIQIGPSKGYLEIDTITPPATPDQPRFRTLMRDGFESQPLSSEEVKALLGPSQFDAMMAAGSNWLFRLLKITSWVGVAWVLLGFAGQFAFAGRMIVQWFVSEREKQSVVPASFWWMSLFGGLAVFAYFVWRQDIVGVLGQCSGVVIYARNLKLIAKNKRRAERDAAAALEQQSASGATGALS
jgi:lipid-A-disaccharide synthase-like uncharacterized protein